MAKQASVNQQGIRTYVRVLRNRDFFWLWFSQLISMTGDLFTFMAVPFFITYLYESSEVVGAAAGDLPPEAKYMIGLTTLAFTLPRLLGIFTGVFVDRWNRKSTMVVANRIAALVMLIPLMVTSRDMAWLLIISNFLLALTTRFIQPAQQASLPQLVSEEDLLAANGLVSQTQTIAFILGPLLAGITLQFLPVKAAFLIDSFTFLLASVIIRLLVHIPQLENAPEGRGAKAIFGEIWEGLRFTLVTRLLLVTVISFSISQGGLGGINAMWIPFLKETFGVGPAGVAVVDMAQGIGMALGGILLAYLIGRFSKLALVAVGHILIAVAVIGMGTAPEFYIVVLMGVLIGASLIPAQSGFMTIMQMAIPNKLQGRVFSAYFAITQFAGVLMIAIVTGLVVAIPLRAIFVGGGLVVIVANLLWVILVRNDVRNLEERSQSGVQKIMTGPASTQATASD